MLRGRLEEVIDLGAGFWIWRVRHPYWKPSDDWDPVVTTTVVKSRGEVFVIDPIAPDDAAKIVWERLDVDPPTQLVGRVLLTPPIYPALDCLRSIPALNCPEAS